MMRPLISAAILAAVGISVLGGCATEELAPVTTFADVPVPIAEPMPIPPQESRVLVPAKKTKKVSRRTVKPVTVDAVTQFPYEENRIYPIAVSPGYFTAIHLEPGETMPGKAMLGEPDPADWLIEKTAAGTSRGNEVVLLIKPGRPGISTNLFIPTSTRTYQLDVTSYAKRAMDWVRWSYPDMQRQSISNMVAGPSMIAASNSGSCSIAETPFDPMTLDRNYSIAVTSGDSPRWLPVSAFSIGNKSFIEFPARLGQVSAPALFMVDGNGATAPAPFRVRGRFYEVDRTLRVSELRNGESIVRITRIGA